MAAMLNPCRLASRIEELQRNEAAVQAEVARLTEELTDARERLTADGAEKDALATELQMLRESALKDKGKRPVCLAISSSNGSPGSMILPG